MKEKIHKLGQILERLPFQHLLKSVQLGWIALEWTHIRMQPLQNVDNIHMTVRAYENYTQVHL